jgi:hypothetical protein
MKIKAKGKEKEGRSKRSELASGVKIKSKANYSIPAGILAISTVFLAAWYYIGEFYQGAIFFFAKLIFLAMGYTPLQISAVNLSGAYLGNFNLVPLVALAIATLGWELRKRGGMLVIGIPLLFLLHVLDLVAHFPMYFHGSGIAQLVVYSIGVAGVAMPFIIWLVLLPQNVF